MAVKQAAFQSKSHQGRHHAPVRASTRSERPKRMITIPAIRLKSVRRRACLQSPKVTTTPKMIQKPASMRLPVLSRSSKRCSRTSFRMTLPGDRPLSSPARMLASFEVGLKVVYSKQRFMIAKEIQDRLRRSATRKPRPSRPATSRPGRASTAKGIFFSASAPR